MGKDTFLVFQSLLVYAWFTLVPVDSDIRQNVLRSARADLFFVFFLQMYDRLYVWVYSYVKLLNCIIHFLYSLLLAAQLTRP